jgi:hypothetical protein
MPEALPRWKAYAIPLATLIVPGLGHLLLKRPGRAAVFFAVILAMFGLGLTLNGGLFAFTGSNWLFRLAALGEAGMGLFYLGGRILGWGFVDAARISEIMFGYGNTCLVTAGLMNMLLIMDGYDIAIGRKE